MKITIDSKRDGGAIRINGKQVGYIEAYSGEAYVRFATEDVEFFGYGVTETVARCKYNKPYTRAKQFAKAALIAANGDFRKLALLGKGGVCGTDLLEVFELPDRMHRLVVEKARAIGSLADRLNEEKQAHRETEIALEQVLKREAA